MQLRCIPEAQAVCTGARSVCPGRDHTRQSGVNSMCAQQNCVLRCSYDRLHRLRTTVLGPEAEQAQDRVHQFRYGGHTVRYSQLRRRPR